MRAQPRQEDGTSTTPQTDEVPCDVLVTGSGATGLMVAITAKLRGLDVQVVEKGPYVGGCSAYSYGMFWMPCNPVAARAGIADDRTSALAYLRGEMGDRFDQSEVESYLDNGPRMVGFLERECGLRFEVRENFPDYHSERPGAAEAGRTIAPAVYDARALGGGLRRLRPPRASFFGMSFTPAENRLISSRSPAGLRYLGGRFARHMLDLVTHGRSTLLTGGNALVAGLLKTATDLHIPIHTHSALKELLQEHGRVSGGLVQSATRRWRIHARRGVVLACGGFAQDLARCERWFPRPSSGTQSWSLAPPECNGDGLRLAMALGATPDLALNNAGFWAPVSRLPDAAGTLSIHSHDRCRPGFMAITRDGRRFANEADPNHHFCEALLRATPSGQAPEAWLVCDQQALSCTGLGDVIYGSPFPVGKHLRSGYLLKRDSLEALAAAMGVDATVFRNTVECFNAAAAVGCDDAFGKGASRFNRFMGSAENEPNPCLGPLKRAPFYAVKITVGHMATLAGLRTDKVGRALDDAGNPIPGLYLAGNDRVNLFRGACPGGGITLGPGMTGAFLTGLSLAEVQSREGCAVTHGSPDVQQNPGHRPTREEPARESQSILT